MKLFKRIFIANRGEIAVRIIRACRELGITAVVGYSEADRSSLAVRLADEAYFLGESPSAESYLNIPKIVRLIRETACEAVHPGYGFLSERAAFAQSCEEEDIVFIGPKSGMIDLMGDKTKARNALRSAGTPVVPGTMEPVGELPEALKTAEQLGYPVMIKAAAGGGGKGLRMVSNRKEFEAGFRLAQSEAKAAFGDESIYLEKAIPSPHHVEVQVLGDHYGNIIHLGERECSIQRRHQKVIEESPSPFIRRETREKMCSTAVRAAKEIGYTNAGTMEFLVDADQNFYFLEMNTRIQVEHPVTEMVTGVDLVKEQILLAAGNPLSRRQEEIEFRGAAIECRIYAEDPESSFMPSPGKIKGLRLPGGPGIRDDSGIYDGFEVPIYYDPLLSKLVAWGNNREEAIVRMMRALEEYTVLGIKTTIAFYQRVLQTPTFKSGITTTSFLDEYFESADRWRHHPSEEIAILAAAIAEYERLKSAVSHRPESTSASNAWKLLARKESLGQ